MTPLKGSQTDMDKQKDNEAESDKFQTIAPEKDNPVGRNSKLENLATRSLKKMNSQAMRQVTEHLAILNLPSENFN